MGDKDPPPFGYTFSSDFFHGASTPLDSHGQSLLSDMEGQSLADFFSNTDPFSLSDAQPFGAPADTKLPANDFSDWSFMAPPTVHHVSATIPDQAQLHQAFPNDAAMFAQPTLPAHHFAHMAPTHDDLQAASTLFNNSQHGPYVAHHNPPFHDHAASSNTNNNTTNTNNTTINNTASNNNTHPSRPMVATSRGLLNEQLAALLPNHAAPGSLDAHLAAHWAGNDVQQRHDAEFGPLLHRPSLKRTYAFGTDDSFNNPAGFSAPHNETEDQVTRRLMRDMRHSQTFIPDMAAAAAEPMPHATPTDDASDDDSDETSSADDDQPSRKRKKRATVKKEPIRKTAPGTRVGKPKKPPVDDAKKKRATAAAQKLQRENLSEEQKRSNHILSEQKRRNLIKRGFDDLHDLVPEIRNGGLSKSSVLMEAANFLDKLIDDNNALLKLVGGVEA